jgi:choline-glycine betaine transporter
MKLHWLFRKLDELWLGTKILAAQWIALAFALAAVLAFGTIAFDVGVEGLRWLQTDSWTSSKTIAEAFSACGRFRTRCFGCMPRLESCVS